MNGMHEKMKNFSQRSQNKRADFTDTMESEEQILKKKLMVKTQALLILSQDLDQCRMQRDRFRLMAEQLQENLDQRKTEEKLNNSKNLPESSIFKYNDNLDENTTMLDLLIESQEKNKCLQLQVDTLRQKLKESQADIKALRNNKNVYTNFKTEEITPYVHQREELIEQLEQMNIKIRQLKIDLKSVIDEKQELEVEKDAYKCKAHRLNYELSKALNASQPVDIDSLINENRFLQDRLKHLLEEKELERQSVKKYKNMLENKKLKGSVKLGANNSIGSVMTFKQVEELLKEGPNIPSHKVTAALTELHSLCLALLEALNDKTLALAHQKKANKILASRICELDKTVQSPTIKLLKGYSNENVNAKLDETEDTNSELCTEKISNEINEIEDSIKSSLEDELGSLNNITEKNEYQKTENYFDQESTSKSARPFADTDFLLQCTDEKVVLSSLPDNLKEMVISAIDELKFKWNEETKKL